MEVETQTVEITRKRGKPRKLDADPNLSYNEYRRLYQNNYYKLHPRTPTKVKLTEEQVRQRDLEYAKKYYERNKERMIAQIMEAQRRKREEKNKLKAGAAEKADCVLKES